MAIKKRGHLPLLDVSGESIPEAWENSCLEILKRGIVYTRGDEQDSGEQLDSMMRIEIRNPDADPFAHLMGGTNALDQPLLDYYYEMLGAKDSWIKDFSDPKDTRWDYMYHERLGKYPNPEGKPIDQIEFAIQRLINRPFSRRTNIITWYPKRDTQAKDTPCLQRLWFNIVEGDEAGKGHLDAHYSFRSRNVLNAAFGNMHGLYMLICHIRDRVEKGAGVSLALRMVDSVDSYHVNSHDLEMFMKIIGVNVQDRREKGGIENRAWAREQVIPGLRDSREYVEGTILEQTAKHYKGDMEKEGDRVKAIGDRVFYLLDKYAPKKDGS